MTTTSSADAAAFSPGEARSRYRDGLAIAFLSLRPLRLANLLGLGEELRQIDGQLVPALVVLASETVIVAARMIR